MFAIDQPDSEEIQPLFEVWHRDPPISVEELENMTEGNEELQETLEIMLKSCLQYTITVAKYKRLAERDNEEEIGKSEEWRDVDSMRRIVHDATIDNINIFSRQLEAHQKDNSWMQEVVANRASYGRFALLITLSRI